jgi:starvation-inducible DNA-binding protein
LLFDEHAEQLFAMTDPIAERVRKLGETTIRSTGQIARMQRVLDNELIEVWIDETERRTWFLFEAHRHTDSTGR